MFRFRSQNSHLINMYATDNKTVLTLRAQCQSPVSFAHPAPVMYPRPLKTHRMVKKPSKVL